MTEVIPQETGPVFQVRGQDHAVSPVNETGERHDDAEDEKVSSVVVGFDAAGRRFVFVGPDGPFVDGDEAEEESPEEADPADDQVGEAPAYKPVEKTGGEGGADHAQIAEGPVDAQRRPRFRMPMEIMPIPAAW